MKALARFKKGSLVRISCYLGGCEGISIIVILGEEREIHPSFVRGGGAGRLRWQPSAMAKGFELGKTSGGSGHCNCSGCNTLFGGVVVISNGRGRKATIFGYDPEPA